MIRHPFIPTFRRVVRPLAFAALFVLPCGAQEGSAPGVAYGPLQGPLDPRNVVVKYFSPTAYDAGELVSSATSLFGETITVRIPPPEGSDPTQPYTTDLPHFVVLRNTIVIRDSAAAAQQIAQLLGELDQTEKKRADEAAKRDSDQQMRQFQIDVENQQREIVQRGEAADTMVQIRPRYVSLDTINTALAPFQRQVTFMKDGRSAWTTNNITAVADAQMFVVCESKERAAQLTQLVEQLDRPQPQAVVSVTLIRAADESKAELPRELVENLRALVPYKAFEPLTVGILRCSLATGRTSELSMDLGDRGSANFSFNPEAFNPDSGELTLSQCAFNLQLAPERPMTNETTHSFTTNLTFRSGEYVVLGAVGAKPIFVVLRAELVKKST